jgi:hypothetical protein
MTYQRDDVISSETNGSSRQAEKGICVRPCLQHEVRGSGGGAVLHTAHGGGERLHATTEGGQHLGTST